MRKIIFIVCLLFTLKCSATTFPIPIVSGKPTLTSMAGHSIGDIGTIAAGVYTGFNFSNLKGITIQPLSGQYAADVFFTGTGTIASDSGCTFNGLTSTGVAGSAINSDATHNEYLTLSHWRFYNIAGSAWTANGNWPWTSGNSSTFQLYIINMDSIYEYKAYSLLHCGFGDMSQNHPNPSNVSDSIVITRFVSEENAAVTEAGTEVRCAGLFRADFHDWKLTQTSVAGASGDVGSAYIKGGNGKFYRIYRNGGPGYIVRIYGLAEISHPRDVLTWDCAKFNSTEYGLEDFRWDATMLIAGATQSDGFQIYNCTLGNAAESIGYWSSLGVIGNVDPAQINRMRNNLGFNQKTNGKPFIGMNQSGGTWNNDTANNQYFVSATAAKLDSITAAVTNAQGSFALYAPTASSPGATLHGGVSNPFTATDYLGASLRTPPDLGYVQLPGAAVPCPCLVGLHKGYKKYVRRPTSGSGIDFNNDFNNDFH